MARVKITHKVSITKEPVAGYCCYRKGKLVYIESGSYEIGGRLSNFFSWRVVKPDGSLGKSHAGYWDRSWEWH